MQRADPTSAAVSTRGEHRAQPAPPGHQDEHHERPAGRYHCSSMASDQVCSSGEGACDWSA